MHEAHDGGQEEKNMSSIKHSSALRPQASKLITQISHYLLYIIGLLVLTFAYLEYRSHGGIWIKWDWMFISGLIAFIIALYFGRTISDKMDQLLNRLVNREVLKLSSKELSSLNSQMDQRSRMTSGVLSVIVGLALLIANLTAYQSPTLYMPEIVLDTVLGFVAGYYIGQMIAFSTLGRMVTSDHIPVETKPGHIDRAAGLKPIGDFYFFQAMILAMPCLFLALWWFIIPIWTPWYSSWRSSYIGLLALALIFEILAFIVPMLEFHKIMRKQKTAHQVEADKFSKQILELENKIVNEPDPKLSKTLEDQREILRNKYWEIEKMPTWPVDGITRRRFTINNLFLFLPILLDLISASESWRNFLDIVIKIFSQNGV